ncbi:PLP-dependent cysteine synthase family protein [Butyrivibrio sp. INlla21]|uniref:PLP-dependent cysteine synthase family protein n=1 Tax=Butyrivibrio sp. INlla21 TaxID=1520811 RepID=UPI0008DEB99D|nr:PLP-dependent cysteine synthase family protein [Butyrivibrio sp. INlla21]SFU54927.1 cysteine synthase A [Butyrivibrio sp. INlla21]
MSRVYKSITELVGRTPLLELSGYEKKHNLKANIIGKLEYFNPNQSVKDRIALAMIEDAEKSGKLKPGDTVVETTSGNTGIGLAAIAAAKGYPFRVYIQDQVSKERFQVIQAFGGKTIKLGEEPVIAKVLEETGGDFVAAIKALKEDVLDKEDHVVFLDQCSNPANPAVHKRTTGPEIWEDTDGQVDILVACVGTGGTVSGTGAYLKEKNPNIKIVAVQPGPNSLPDADKNPPEEEITGVHPFEGVPDNLVPATMDRNIYDEYLEVEALDAYNAARELAANDGVLIGTSSGAALHAARVLAEREENKGKKIVAVFPDTGLRYLSTNLFAKAQD